MTIKQTVFNLLANDAGIRAELAASTIDPSLPAIYDFWATADAPAPYINSTWGHTPDGTDRHQINAT